MCKKYKLKRSNESTILYIPISQIADYVNYLLNSHFTQLLKEVSDCQSVPSFLSKRNLTKGVKYTKELLKSGKYIEQR